METTTDRPVGYDPPFGFGISDSREFDSDDPRSARFFMDEPDDRSLAVGFGYPSEECARAAAGRWLSAAWSAGRCRFRPDEITVEIAPDRDGGGWGTDWPPELRKIGREHNQATCPYGCATEGRTT